MAKSKKATESISVKKAAAKKVATKKAVTKKAAKKASPKKAAVKAAPTATPELPKITADITQPIATENTAVAIDTNAPFFMVKIGNKFCCMERQGTHAIEHASFLKKTNVYFT